MSYLRLFPIVLKKHKIYYKFVPKCGCTTIKRYLAKSIDKDPGDIHVYFHSRKKEFNSVEDLNGYYKFCVVRDPLERFVSCYNNKILDEDTRVKVENMVEINHKLKLYNLEVKPDIDYFINNFFLYRELTEIYETHTMKYVDILGTNTSYYDDVYNMRDINTQLMPKLKSITGTDYTKGKKNKSKHLLKVSDLSSSQLDKLKEFYKDDYVTYGRYF